MEELKPPDDLPYNERMARAALWILGFIFRESESKNPALKECPHLAIKPVRDELQRLLSDSKSRQILSEVTQIPTDDIDKLLSLLITLAKG